MVTPEAGPLRLDFDRWTGLASPSSSRHTPGRSGIRQNRPWRRRSRPTIGPWCALSNGR